ncbi:uncharacterized protein LOC141585872 [Silene latifolia]|uniref:uncharacterized protein LOC141585872 n=1 Tax=Silene latifolia TaxID=37657 RepID=UPI003D781E3D
MARIRGIGARKLSYAGRLVLIQSVLHNLHNYWARIFILPKTVLQHIDRLCRKFLWHGNELKDSPALVAWEYVCKPTRKGGLGLKCLYWWNIAAVAKYAWWIAKKTDHLWVRWIHAVYMKDKDWEVYEPGQGASWAWKKICWVKNLIKPFLFSGGFGDYSIKLGYSWLVDEGPDKAWHPWVTNKLMVPKHGFILWLMAHRRLLTQDRLMRMGVIHSNCCYLCGLDAESVEHLFFQCIYSKKCLALMSEWLNVDILEQQVLDWWVKYRNRSLLIKKTVAAAVAALIYAIWRCRNQSRMEGYLLTPGTVFKNCKSEIRMRLRCNRVGSVVRGVQIWRERICM